MSLLIDGYNLIHAANILPRGVGPGTLERSRLALLNLLAESLTESQCQHTTVVFDAAGAPPGLPDTLRHRGLTVRFSKGYPDADELIEELIAADSAPKKLTVVSSDHRLHRAARRRKAQPIDSDVWHSELLRLRSHRRNANKPTMLKPSGSISAGEVEYWLGKFEIDETMELPSGPQRPAAQSNKSQQTDDSDKPPDLDEEEEIFPPGYADDVWKEFEEDR